MGEARTAVDLRLAKGEITAEEHARIVALIDPAVTPPNNGAATLTDPVDQAPDKVAEVQPGKHGITEPGPKSDAPKVNSGHNTKQILAWVFGAFFLVMIVNSCVNSAGTVRITNLSADGWFISTVSGTIVNDGPSGDVWIWFEQNGKKICPRSTYMLENSEKKFSFDCYDMKEGNFSGHGSKNPPSSVSNAAQGL